MTYRDPLEWEATCATLRPSSPAWRAATVAIWGERPLSNEDERLFVELSGGVPAPVGGSDNVLVVARRRDFKTGWAARCGFFEARYGGHEVALEPGQIGIVGIVAPLREQSAELVRYVHGLASLPSERAHVRRVTADGVEFANNTAIKIVTASDVAVSGATWIMGIIDEAAKLPGAEATTPDSAIVASLRPALAPIRGAPRRKFIMLTSAFLQSGIAYETDLACFGKSDAPTLVLHGAIGHESPARLNPNLDRQWLERERERDPGAFAREFELEWQSALTECWFGTPAIVASTDAGRTEPLPFEIGRRYLVAADAAFARDNFAIAVATSEQLLDSTTFELTPRRTFVVHVEVLKPEPGRALSPRQCVDRTVAVMRRYQTDYVYLDQYCAQPLIEAFEDRSCRAKQIDWTGSGANSKSARYRAMRESMTDGAVRLPNDPPLLREFHRVRGHMTQSGNERIEAIGRGVDDRVSAVVMACSVAMEQSPSRADKDVTWWERRQKQLNDQKIDAFFNGFG